MNAPDQLQDSGLGDGRLLGQILQAGVVTLDEAQRCCFATADACDLLGASDVVSLRDGWESICSQLALSDLAVLSAHDPPLQRRVNLRTAQGVRLLRIEVFATAAGGRIRHVMLVRDRMRLVRTDRAQLMAGEAHANRHILSGLVHDAKGPLNNFYLSLSLLSSWLERLEATAIPGAARERCVRYLTVLQTEAARLSDVLTDIHALTQPGAAALQRVDLCSVLRDVLRVLRHEVTMREAALQLEVGTEPAWIVGDPHPMRLALLGLMTCVLDATPAGGVVIVRIGKAEGRAQWLLQIAGNDVALPAGLASELFRIGCASESDFPAEIASRMILEAHGGELTIDTVASRQSGVTIRLPEAPLDEGVSSSLALDAPRLLSGK